MYLEGQQILVIDDDARRRQLSERMLIAEGFAVTAVGDGFSAIRAAQNGRFLLAIAAVSLPGTLDGPATIRQLRAHQPWLKALFTDEAGCRTQCPERAGDDFIAAPFDRRELLGCVFELLQREAPHGRAGSCDRSRAG